MVYALIGTGSVHEGCVHFSHVVKISILIAQYFGGTNPNDIQIQMELKFIGLKPIFFCYFFLMHKTTFYSM